jgi:hypothetical protein
MIDLLQALGIAVPASKKSSQLSFQFSPRVLCQKRPRDEDDEEDALREENKQLKVTIPFKIKLTL